MIKIKNLLAYIFFHVVLLSYFSAQTFTNLNRLKYMELSILL